MAQIVKYEIKAGTRYRVRYRTPDGRQTDKRGFKLKRDAEAFANTVEVAKLKGEYVAPSLGRVTVGECGEAWIKRQKGHLKRNSYRSIETSWRVHVKPEWGRHQLAAIRFTDVQAWVAALAQRRGAKVVRAAHGVLAAILDDAVRDRWLAANPARGVKLPAITKAPHRYLSATQLHMLAGESGRYGSLILLLGLGGVRWGEAAGLRVSDVDFLRRKVTVHENASGGGTGSLKGGEFRVIVLPQFVVDQLAATVVGIERDALIWPSKTGGHLKAPATHDSWLSGAVRRCQKADKTFPRITAHDLRHTAASLAISAGASVKAVQRMLGHKSAAMTLDTYADLFDEDLTAVADKLDKSVGKMWAKPDSAVGGRPLKLAATSKDVADFEAPPDGLEPFLATNSDP